ncbi:hypothetical protein AA14337_3012 [Acetobacter malorum DSM 14337]|uniref:Uncharacterized protein n=1 Tax=Acetobacter malorum DSM 14337 TaxID=1307910 RepID=A0ABQ0PZ49_9PROT|nr:hypothetical protein AA14337_3012 [Acetobacter malorum DSM 14337]
MLPFLLPPPQWKRHLAALMGIVAPPAFRSEEIGSLSFTTITITAAAIFPAWPQVL